MKIYIVAHRARVIDMGRLSSVFDELQACDLIDAIVGSDMRGPRKQRVKAVGAVGLGEIKLDGATQTLKTFEIRVQWEDEKDPDWLDTATILHTIDYEDEVSKTESESSK